MNNEKQSTREPWRGSESDYKYVDQVGTVKAIYAPDGSGILAFVFKKNAIQCNASRIVACVNACAGVEDPEKFIEAAKKDKIWHQRAAAFLAEKGLQDQFYQWVDKQQQ